MRFALLVVFSLLTTAVTAKEVNVYSYRQAFLVEPLFNAFTEKTGIKVNVVFAKEGIAERLKREGEHSPADIILTTDFSRLLELQDDALFQPVTSDTLLNAIPSQFRAQDNTWFALTSRVRNIYSAKSLGDIAFTYESLADPKWQGKICTRSGKHPYNVGLVASMIAHHGETYTEQWLTGVKANLARKPQGNDRDQVKAIHQQLCQLSLGNSYYFGNMMNDPEQKAWADAVNINFPNQADRGSHINISGMGLAKYSPNKVNALALMEFLVSDQAQEQYAQTNMEYPVKPGVAQSPLVASWGQYKADDISLVEVAKHRQAALMLLDKVKFDL